MIQWDKLPPYLSLGQVEACGIKRHIVPALVAEGTLTIQKIAAIKRTYYHKYAVRRFVEAGELGQSSRQKESLLP